MPITNLKENTTHGIAAFPVALYNSKRPIPYQWHYEEEFIYMIHGSAYYNINGKSILLRPGDCAFCRSGALHSMMFKPEEDVNFYALLFNSSYIFGSNDINRKYFDNNFRINHFFSPYVPVENEAIEVIKTICDWMEKKEFGYEVEVKSLLIKIYSIILQKKLYTQNPKENLFIQTDKNIASAINHIHIHFSEKISIKELAALTGYSTTYFENIFKSYTSKTPVEYIILCRLKQAEKMLEEVGSDILEIAIACGFPNTSYFIRTFKKYYHLTPHQYRLAHNATK